MDTAKERLSELLFQGLDPATDGGLRQKELLRRTREA
jgi:hypothetical protein